MEDEVDGRPLAKRKPSASSAAAVGTSSKRPKLSRAGIPRRADQAPPDVAHHLPAEIWHRIFTCLPPKTLGSLLAVNKLFHGYLDPRPGVGVKMAAAQTSRPPVLPPMKPDAIWRVSRRLFWPQMPGPLQGKSEVDMWRLCCTRACQFCGFRDGGADAVKVQDQWHRGPGAKGVVPVFPFFVASCGSCFVARTIKEIDVFLSNATPSFLVTGLATAFLSPQTHVIAPQALANATSPGQMQVTKVFYPAHIAEIHREFEAVKALGHAAAEEWVKGLDARGKKLLVDASRWERWFLSGGVQEMRRARPIAQVSPNDPAAHSSRRVIGSPGDGRALHDPAPVGHDIFGRSSHEEAKALGTRRVGEIERPASSIDPDGLAHLASSQAPAQKTSQLGDEAWQMLKDRLARNGDADMRNEESKVESKPTQPPSEAPTREVTDKDWDDAQGPLRATISDLADEIIRDKWDEGEKVSKKEAAQFAADVLLFVRERFYAQIAHETAARRATGKKPIVEPPEGPWTQKLTLENMKWVFDMKIKRHTDRHRKELFICNGCQGPRKAFGLESVIQHYAAKHTTALSVGSVVVHWRAEWPETPIFDPDPKQKRSKPAPGNAPVPATKDQASNGYNGLPGLPAMQHPPADLLGSTYGYGMAAPTAMHTTPYVPAMGPAAPTYPGLETAAQPPFSAWGQYGIAHPPALAQTMAANGDGISSGGVDGDRRTGKPGAPNTKNNSQGYTERLNFASRAARQAWKNVKKADRHSSDADKAARFISMVANDYQTKFESMPLEIFTDALLNRKGFREARKWAGLRCKACAGVRGVNEEEQTFGFSELLDHFKSMHQDMLHTDVSGRRVDWRSDMVLPPENGAPSGTRKELAPPASNSKQKGQTAAKKASEKVDAAQVQREASSSDSYEPEYNPEDIQIYQEPPLQTKSEGHSYAGPDLGDDDVPDLRPASAVYGTKHPQRSANGSKHRRGRGVEGIAGNHDLVRRGEGSRPEPAREPPARIEEDGFEVLGSLESRSTIGHRVQVPSEFTTREVRYEAAHAQRAPPRGAYMVEPEYASHHPHDVALLRIMRPPDHYAEELHPERSGRVAYRPSAAYYPGEDQHGTYRSYADEPRLRPAQAQAPGHEEYETVEVRDPRGYYLIRRPIPRDIAPAAYYPHEAAYRGAEQRAARQGTVFEDSLRHGHHHHEHHQHQQPNHHRSSAHLHQARPRRPPSRMDYEEYDPRFPAPEAVAAATAVSATGAAPAWHESGRGNGGLP